MNCVFAIHLRCYVVGSELRGHQVSLINFGKAKVTQLHGCILWKRHDHSVSSMNVEREQKHNLAASCAKKNLSLLMSQWLEFPLTKCV